MASIEYTAFEAAGLASLQTSDVILIEDNHVLEKTIATLEGSGLKREGVTIFKVPRQSEFPLTIKYVVEELGKNAVSVIATPEVLLHLLPLVDDYTKKLAAQGKASFSLSFNIGVVSTDKNSVSASNIFAFSDLIVGIISSNSTQECYDMAIVSGLVAKTTFIPMINYFDAAYLDSTKTTGGSQQNIVDVLTPEQLETYEDAVKVELKKLVDEHQKTQQSLSDSAEQQEEQTNESVATDSEYLVDGNIIKQVIYPAITDLVLEGYPSKNYNEVESDIPSDSVSTLVISPYFSKVQRESYTEKTGFLGIRVYRPFPQDKFVKAIPQNVDTLVILEQLGESAKVWGPMVFDIVPALQKSAKSNEKTKPVQAKIVDGLTSSISVLQILESPKYLEKVLEYASSKNSSTILRIDDVFLNNKIAEQVESGEAANAQHNKDEEKLGLEVAARLPYEQMLNTTFSERLNVINAIHSKTVWGPSEKLETNPEFGFGKFVNTHQRQNNLKKLVLDILGDANISLGSETREALTEWMKKSDEPSLTFDSKLAERIVQLVETSTDIPEQKLNQLAELAPYFFKKSNWLVGADEWAADIGNSGVHHVISSGYNVNMLILDTDSYQKPQEATETHTLKLNNKKDIGLYALNYGSVYVASISAFASYSQAMTALIEADAYPGPAIVLAHLPKSTEKLISSSYSAIETMKLAKQAVDGGRWPLYRWHPAGQGEVKEQFVLDSEKLRNELQEFLDRSNKLAVMSTVAPKYYSGVDNSLEARKKKEAEEAASRDLQKLMAGLRTGPPLTILYASDAHNAEDAAKRVNRGAKLRGMNPEIICMEDFEVDELEYKENVVFIVSTAGQGEFPTNGRKFWKALSTASMNLSNLKYSVFGLGDSQYWPRKEEYIYYNKPGKDLDRRFVELGANRVLEIGLGDDQDSEGWEAGFNNWEPQLWGAFGVTASIGGADGAGLLDDEPPTITDEQNKIQSNYLRGNILTELADDSKGNVDDFTGKLLKFHGTYGQDDRDLREQRKADGLSPAYSFMIRVRLPGGRATCDQWKSMDDLANTYANGTIKITTRQTFQLHGVLKKNLRTTIGEMNRALMDTIAACGDVNRNVVATANPMQPHLHQEVYELARDISEHLLPKTTAYHEIWCGGEMVAGKAVSPLSVDYGQQDGEQIVEPLYGKAYLPRKFKIAIAIPPENDVDVFAYDLGLIAILDAETQTKIVGYNVAVGGGMGMTHNNKKTYPRLASILGYLPKDKIIDTCEKIVMVQRDHGDRVNRKHARMKYTIDDHGVDWFREQVELRMNAKFEPERPYSFTRNGDRYGWVTTRSGFNNYTLFIQNGRVADIPGYPLKTALRHLADVHKGYLQLTCNSHLIIADVADADVPTIENLLKSYNVHNKSLSALRLHSMACTALPTCGLAMAESERYLPSLVQLLEHHIDEAGLRNDAITIRMTGCPNGCARPYNAEIALVGKAPGVYNLYLGGAHDGSRLNKLLSASVDEQQIIELLAPIIKQYALERLNEHEKFGDFVIRAGIVNETRFGMDFHD